MHPQTDWLARLVTSLQRSGPEAEAALGYIREQGVRLSVRRQATGARWRPGKRVELNPAYLQAGVDDTYAVSLVIHEVRHLQQGFITALSVYGELDAWQLQFGFIRSRTGRFHDSPGKDHVITQLMAIPLRWNRSDLEHARKLMRAYSGPKYRVDLLPLYPLAREILSLLSGRDR